MDDDRQLNPDYSERRIIVQDKHKKDEGKLRRFVVNPMRGLMNFEVKDKKKERLTA